jgi:Protein of unknown function (DUF2796)
MFANLNRACFALFFAISAQNVNALNAHEHGKAEIRLAVDNAKILLVFQTPQDNLVGIERAPKSAGELATAKLAIENLKLGNKLFAINPEAACVFKEITINAPNLMSPILATAKTAEHADVEVSYSLECAKPGQLNTIGVNVFDVFKSIKVIQVQFADSKKQKSVRLTSSARIIKF